MSTAESPFKVPEAETQPLARRMTYEEFLAWADEDTLAEWVNGEVIVFMPPKDIHQMLVVFLDRVIGFFVEAFDLGRLYVAPFEYKLSAGGSSREPDLLFLAKDHLDRITEERVIGPPDLIIEIVSDDSLRRDYVDKLGEYQAAGVLEYWVIDNRSHRRQTRFYQLAANRTYQQVAVGEDGIYRSEILSHFWLRVDWLWQEQPDALRAIAEIVGPEQVVQALHRAVERSKQ